MTLTPETEPNGELFTSLEGIERGNALLAKLQDLLPEESMPDNAWEYGEFGEITGVTYLRDLTQEIAMQGGYVETVHKQLNKLVEAEQKICRFPERLVEPDHAELSEITNQLDKFSEQEILRVAGIEDINDALHDINRKLMNVAVDYFQLQLDKIRSTTKVFLDGNKTMYPDFWKVCDQVDTMRTAVGIIGRDSIRRVPRV